MKLRSSIRNKGNVLKKVSPKNVKKAKERKRVLIKHTEKVCKNEIDCVSNKGTLNKSTIKCALSNEKALNNLPLLDDFQKVPARKLVPSNLSDTSSSSRNQGTVPKNVSDDYIEFSKRKGKIVASTPLPSRSHRTTTRSILIESNLTGSYWSPKSPSLRKHRKLSNSRSKSCPDNRGKPPKRASNNSCPNKQTHKKLPCRSENDITIPNFSQNVPRSTKRSGGKRKAKHVVDSYLSYDFTSVNTKKVSNRSLLQQSLVLHKVYPQIHGNDFNNTEVSTLNKRKRKKLYSSKTSIFTKSPLEGGTKSILKSSTYKFALSKRKKNANKTVDFKPLVDSMEIDLDKENKDFSIVKCDNEISLRIKTSDVDKFRDSNEGSELNVTQEVVDRLNNKTDNDDDFIRSKDKDKKNLSKLVNGCLDGSYIPPPESEDKTVNGKLLCSVPKDCTVLIDGIPSKPSEGRKEIIDKQSSDDKYSLAENPSEGVIKSLTKTSRSAHKKKRLLHSKQFKNVFDLECDNNEMPPVGPEVSCNKTIIESVMHGKLQF